MDRYNNTPYLLESLNSPGESRYWQPRTRPNPVLAKVQEKARKDKIYALTNPGNWER
jgi:hypothetical protein